MSDFNFKELFKFSTPYTRKRYWGVIGFGFLINIVLAIVLGVVSAVIPPLALVTFVMGFAFWWVFYAAVIKRLRDADMSLWWALTLFLPLLNLVALVVFGCIGSAAGKNGKSAKGPLITGILLGLTMLILPALVIATIGYHMINATAPAPMPEPAMESRVSVSGTEVPVEAAPAPAAEKVDGAAPAPENAPVPEAPVETPQAQ